MKSRDSAPRTATFGMRNRYWNLVQHARPDWIILAAAYTDVDGCETNRDLAFDVNCRGAVNVAQAAKQHGAACCFSARTMSSMERRRHPTRPATHASPRSVYGQSKAEAEVQLARFCRTAASSELPGCLAPGGKCFPDTILKLAASRASNWKWLAISAALRPTPVDLARAIIQLCRKGASGIVHVTNRGECSWYEFAREIIATCRTENTLCTRPPATSSCVRAERPKYSVLSPDSLQKYGVAMPDWQDAWRDSCYSASRSSPAQLDRFRWECDGRSPAPPDR